MNRFVRWLGRAASWEGFLALLVLLVAAYGWARVPGFATSFNLSQIAAGVSEKALLVLPMVLLIIAREIDLSVASILGLCSVVLGLLLRAEVPLAAAVAATFAVGAAAGAMNGLLVTRLLLPSLVVTLGTMALFRGLSYILLGTDSVSELPALLTDLGVDNVPGTAVPWIFVPFLLLAPVFAVFLHRTATGRRIYAIGGNPDVALYTGIRVARLRMGMFVASGLVCALASVVLTARLSSARASNGLGFELDVITIALLGGISVFGGRGRMGGVFWALALVALIRNLLALNQISGDAQGLAIGFLLIFSLLLSNGIRRLANTASARRLVQRFSNRRIEGPVP
ncbi:ABC transporter permease [Variovorax sp.]|jgi:rhamnose transport system permease protein|uniref:ABC transporter permease n=1 Tax=Variovorax sp. TaxID=1871043 RepID=UPI0037DA5BAB